LRRSATGADTFPEDVLTLQALLAPTQPGQPVQAIPGAGSNVPLWILGSSLFGAQLAAELGLPYSFASHFMPAALMPALETYRSRFKPSRQLQRPYTMAGINVVAADSDDEARVLFTSLQQQFANLVRGTPGRLPPPVADIDTYWSPAERAHASGMLACSFVGSRETVRHGVTGFVERTGVDELIVATATHDHQARLRSYEILAELLIGGSRVNAGAASR
jgi:luciferase family oxidoreductase group 1